MMLPAFLHLCKLRHGDICRKVQRYFLQEIWFGRGSSSSGKKKSPKNQDGKIQSQKSLRIGEIIFQNATH